MEELYLCLLRPTPHHTPGKSLHVDGIKFAISVCHIMPKIVIKQKWKKFKRLKLVLMSVYITWGKTENKKCSYLTIEIK